jgi:hypothetical protein
MKRILFAAVAASALSAPAFAQSAGSSVGQVGSSVSSTGPVGSSNLDTGSGKLSPVSPNTTDMDQPAGTSLSGSMNSSTGLDMSPTPSPISPGQLAPPDGAGLPELGSPQPSTTDLSGVNSSLSPTTTPDVNR